jgi:hypothetical protein
MVRRINDEGFRWLEPPYTPEEQQLLGGKPPFPEHVRAEAFSVSAGASDERYRDDVWSEFDLTLYYHDGQLLNATVNGRVLGLEAALMLEDVMSDGEGREE